MVIYKGHEVMYPPYTCLSPGALAQQLSCSFPEGPNSAQKRPKNGDISKTIFFFGSKNRLKITQKKSFCCISLYMF